jgi:outer membrane receptor protein involved in Fe transport
VRGAVAGLQQHERLQGAVKGALSRALAVALVVAPCAAHADDVPWAGSVDGRAPGPGAPSPRREPDTELRLTGDELVARGATTLADALDLVPELSVRASGRGGKQADLRGARKSWLKILVDGVPVDDPYYGTFDLTSIPVVDIVEIRLSSSPASPLDGPGGPGGVIEVRTLRALGAQRVAARADASDAPDASGWVGGRALLFPGVGVRASAGGTWGGPDHDVSLDDGSRVRLGEPARRAGGSLRLESHTPDGDLGLDVAVQHRSYATPPGDEAGADVLVVDAEDTARAAAWGETRVGGWQLRGEGFAHALFRDARRFADARMIDLTGREALAADREGLAVAGQRAIGRALILVLAGHLDTERARIVGLMDRVEGGRAGVGAASVGIAWRRGALRIDAAGGVAAPVGTAAWPEAKLAVAWRPPAEGGLDIAVDVAVAHKGRVPTLRERYQLATGNDELAPERATAVDARVQTRPARWLRVDASGYARVVSGYIRLDPASGRLGNLGRLLLGGLDASVEVRPAAAVAAGGSWRVAEASSAEAGAEPLDFLPRHRADAWLSARPDRVLRLDARVRYVDRRRDQQEVLPAYVTTDLSGSWALAAGWRTTLRVDNLLDRRFVVRAHGYHDPGRVVQLVVEAVWP